MRTVTADAHKIVLGSTGETEALQVLFPVASKWAATYGDGIFQLLVLRPGDVSPYAVPITVDGANVVWIVTATETARPGIGKAELSYYVGNTLAKSLVWDTQVLPSLSPPPQDPPAPWQSWVDEVLAAGSAAEASAAEAQQSAEDAEAWAVGQRKGEDVPTTDETHENHAKHYAGLARDSAAEAEDSQDAAAQAQAAAEQAEQGAEDAADAASTSADRAEQAAATAGYMFFETDDRGHVLYTRTENTNVDFDIIDGRLLVHA